MGKELSHCKETQNHFGPNQVIPNHYCTTKSINICIKYRSTGDQKTVNLSLKGCPRQTTKSQPTGDQHLQRNPAYQETKPQRTIEEKQICQQSTFEPNYDVIPLTQSQEEEGGQYDVLDRSREISDTPIGADVIPEEVDSHYTTLQ